jgi:hypothetical protein
MNKGKKELTPLGSTLTNSESKDTLLIGWWKKISALIDLTQFLTENLRQMGTCAQWLFIFF